MGLREPAYRNDPRKIIRYPEGLYIQTIRATDKPLRDTHEDCEWLPIPAPPEVTT